MDGILEISNLPQNVGVEMLELYLESPKAGGHPGAVKRITLVGPGIARVQFDDANSKRCLYISVINVMIQLFLLLVKYCRSMNR